MQAGSTLEIINRVFGYAFTLSAVVGYFTLVLLEQSKSEKVEKRFDETEGAGPAKSVDLAEDIKLMWATVPHERFEVSPVSAINAARRVFASVEMVGLTTNELFGAIGHPKTSNKSGYDLPFWGVRQGVIVYRFDCGNFGWQFNVEVDASGTVTNLVRRWIH